MTNDVLGTGRAFLDLEGRLVERRLTAVLFDGDDPTWVVDAVRAYRNGDGGFGHGFEPDKRCPASLPIDVECALDVLLAAGEGRPGWFAEPAVATLIDDACDWLGSVAAPDGALPLAFPVMEGYPRAEHWSDWTYVPGLNPTAGLAGRLHRIGVTHPWLDRATEWTWTSLESGIGEDAHTLLEVLQFLANVPDRERAAAVGAHVADWLGKLRYFRADPADPEYGVTPLHLASTPDSPWRGLFDDAAIEGHLDRLTRDQQADGGWTITWQPPGQASTLEYRGIETLRALRTLRAYGRI
ncbi:hypothetical protein [Catellatospora tritici]|uniref:hypothetical protein n=1 Tax=Catellatospora tritici TaxID=2851566 RepID=UPI001C2CF78D|nr:hypothetical protein [Catellatospora tritici]MBV1850762.1 hypothetical protein [Catellatospora tritici]MBV1851015.1 hypothetical protein [Catellatospora tritici]